LIMKDSVKSIPLLRFREFQDSWKLAKLSDYGELVNGLTYRPEDISDETDGVLVLRSSNVQGGQLAFEDNVFVKTENYECVLEEDILICVRNGSKRLIGKNALITKEAEGMAFGAFMTVFRSKRNQFIFQLLRTQRYKKIVFINLGATINSINNSALRKFSFYFPSLPEQEKIASFLSAVDKKIQLLKKKKELLEQYKKGVMQKLFDARFEEVDGEKVFHPPALRFKQEDGSDFPDWEEKRLGGIVTFYKGKGLSKSDIVEDGQHKCVRYGELYTLYNEVIENIVSRTDQVLTDSILSKENDVLIPSSGETSIDIATASCIQEESVILGGDLNVLRSNQDGKYLAFVLSSFLRNELAKLSQGVSVIHLYPTHMKRLTVPLPILNEQVRISSFILQLNRQVQKCHMLSTIVTGWKKGLLQKIFI